MRLFGKRDEAEQHFEQAKRYADADKKDFDPRRAIEEFKAAVKAWERQRAMKKRAGWHSPQGGDCRQRDLKICIYTAGDGSRTHDNLLGRYGEGSPYLERSKNPISTP